MEDKNEIRDIAQDVVLNVKVHDQAMLGWVNGKNKYVIPPQIVKELIKAEKIITKVEENNIFMTTELPTLNRNINIVMTYLINESRDKVFIRFAVMEEEYVAEGVEVRQIITEILKDFMPYTPDVLEQSYIKYNIHKKAEEDAEQRTRENPKVLEATLGLHEEVSKVAEEDFELASEKATIELLKYLKLNPNEYNNMIVYQFEKNLENYKKFVLRSDVEACYIPNKVVLDVLNNSIEITNAIMPESPEKETFHSLRENVLTEYKKDVIVGEKKAEETILKNASAENKIGYLNAISIKDGVRENDDTTEKKDINLKASEALKDTNLKASEALKDILALRANIAESKPNDENNKVVGPKCKNIDSILEHEKIKQNIAKTDKEIGEETKVGIAKGATAKGETEKPEGEQVIDPNAVKAGVKLTEIANDKSKKPTAKPAPKKEEKPAQKSDDSKKPSKPKSSSKPSKKPEKTASKKEDKKPTKTYTISGSGLNFTKSMDSETRKESEHRTPNTIYRAKPLENVNTKPSTMVDNNPKVNKTENQNITQNNIPDETQKVDAERLVISSAYNKGSAKGKFASKVEETSIKRNNAFNAKNLGNIINVDDLTNNIPGKDDLAKNIPDIDALTKNIEMKLIQKKNIELEIMNSIDEPTA